MSKKLNSKNHKERVCKDFYPNCQYCSFYATCFPVDEVHEALGRALLAD